ncbi:hypothetical protein PN498_22280 [Oscillatoria sp. CS-180]|uniref:Npun_F0813 family protein n=1 Tax=Oscillatoria sp. CS-180 TaxID=3021720 RepID=UPI00232B93C6|nr:Npun_F0813 family protein [Oscillatoria sp. CS-180]MDB9528736.1 hypothetical protein [Oscillatoria sp. CS-180]
MFILKRQDVDIKNIQHPSTDQPIPILHYQEQTFRLLSVFTAAQEEDAMALWRDLTDNRGKACVLLEEAERYSVWGKIRLDSLSTGQSNAKTSGTAEQLLIQGCLLLLQALFIDVEDLLGNKQAALFEQDITSVLTQWQFPQVTSAKTVKTLLTMDPLATQVPAWKEQHLLKLLEELHRLGKDCFGNANFTERSLEALEDLPANNRQKFMTWLQQSPPGQLWS